jgi:pimeloyl-ACP methyl ester carboxylesterase
MGGNVALRYAGAFPETVTKMVVIEGMGPSPAQMRHRTAKTAPERLRSWVSDKRSLAGRMPRRYATIEDAFARMQGENKHLTPEQARHLTVHGASQNEDGTYSWKFDNYVHSNSPVDYSGKDIQAIWENITCPILFVNGKESWASNPETDGRMKFFKDGHFVEFENAGHWVHHDQLDGFLKAVRAFL